MNAITAIRVPLSIKKIFEFIKSPLYTLTMKSGCCGTDPRLIRAAASSKLIQYAQKHELDLVGFFVQYFLDFF